MDRRGMMRSVQAIAAAIVLTWAGSASAEPGFIDYLDSALDVDASSSPTNCTPCHTPGGGTTENPNLQPFGELLNQDGILPNSQESQFPQVVAEIKQDDLPVYEDLLAGRDPNPDVGSTVHTPEYGCGVARGAKATGRWWLTAFGVLSVVGKRWRARLRRSRRG
jgi:hypothetical protein